MENHMKKTILVAIASLAAFASTSARADSFYFGFSNGYHPAPRYVYVEPRPARVVYVPPPRVIYYSSEPRQHWRHCDKWRRHHEDRSYRQSHYRGWDEDDDDNYDSRVYYRD
jgi:hypothetical protein